ncbi:MAG TPA: hydroxyacid dehydrogenase [Deltaproteobacteria bacterium]|nr:hydroxyacid dehydrogenase [Deltaproteobacteria bacterium]
MRIAVFDAHRYDREMLSSVNREFGYELVFLEPRLTRETVILAQGFPAICVFVNDHVDGEILQTLARGGTRLIALRCAGFNNVDLLAAERLSIKVVRVPAYSPHGVAEHALALVLSLNRKIHRAYLRVREGNFTQEGLMGFDLFGKTVGILGTGKIGSVAAGIFLGLGCKVLAYDQIPNQALAKQAGVSYVNLEKLFSSSDIISLHLPLTPETHHLIDEKAIRQMKPGVMLINTGRGALIDSRALIHGLKSGKIGAAGLDVYEEEENIFFQDLSDKVLQDDVLARLLTFPNVLITAHQGYLTREALTKIARTTLENIRAFEEGKPLVNEVRAEDFVMPSQKPGATL